MLTVSCGMIAFMLIKRDPEQHFFFFFNDTATTEIYTLSLHDALPISSAAANMANRKSLPRQFDSRVAPFRQCRTDRKSTRLNSSHGYISYAVFCLKKKKIQRLGRLRRQVISLAAVHVHHDHARVCCVS